MKLGTGVHGSEPFESQASVIKTWKRIPGEFVHHARSPRVMRQARAAHRDL